MYSFGATYCDGEIVAGIGATSLVYGTRIEIVIVITQAQEDYEDPGIDDSELSRCGGTSSCWVV